MNILALDLATSTGFCKGDGTRLPQSGCIKLPKTGDEVGRFLSAYKSQLVELTQGVDLVVFESPILPASTSFKTIRKLQSLAGITELYCFRQGLKCYEVANSKWKKNLLGEVKIPRSLKPVEKKQIIFDKIKSLKFQPENFDEADAIGVWIYAITKGKGSQNISFK